MVFGCPKTDTQKGQGLGSGPIVPATIFWVLFEYVFLDTPKQCFLPFFNYAFLDTPKPFFDNILWTMPQGDIAIITW